MDRAAAIALVEGLVAIPSLSRHESAAANWLVQQMRAAGYERAFVDAAGNAVGEMGAEDAANTVVLLGHIDTVPGNIPVRIESTAGGDVLYGRGSVDAKGPLATFVAAGARLGAAWARAANLRLVVAGAVEEESATSKGARFIAARLDGVQTAAPIACVIGEPSSWRRITLGYKGRLLLDITATQAMAHTAGPDASLASTVVEIWNHVGAHAALVNTGRDKAFDQLSPSLRRFITATNDAMHDTVDAQFAWRLPPGVDVQPWVGALIARTCALIEAPAPGVEAVAALGGAPVRMRGRIADIVFQFRGWEQPWRGDRQNMLVRSFLSAIRAADATVQPGFVLKTGTSDMNVVGPVWQCPIVAYGPGDSALDHTPNEHLPLDEYWRAVGVLEAALRHLALSLHS